MFTGIIESRGKVLQFERLHESGANLLVHSNFKDLQLGESVAVDGVCLTVTESDANGNARFYVGSETLRRTRFYQIREGLSVNLERALPAHGRLSGHWVQGHVDGKARLAHKSAEQDTWCLKFSLSRDLTRYCVEKGSICLNGVSLTLNQVQDLNPEISEITVHIIPHTWNHTNLSELVLEDEVNVEVDILAKYLERLCLPFQKR